jgi:flagellar assembly protein FliH
MTSYSPIPARRRILRGEDSDGATNVSLLTGSVGGGGHSNGSMNDVIESARREGYDEGYQAAMAEFAAAETSARSAQLRRVTDAIVDAASAVVSTRAQAVEVSGAEAASLAFELAETLVQHELRIGRGAIDALQRAIGLIPSGEEIIVRVNPEDPIDPDEVHALIPEVNFKIVGDRGVEVGGCVVVAGPCRIDAQIGPAIERARHVIASMYADHHPEEASR